jgi:hypothetical protein
VAFGRERAKGLRLVSTENDWTWGTGKDVKGSLEALLMTTAGRAVALEELAGPGAAVLADRMRNPPKVLRDLLDYTGSVNPVSQADLAVKWERFSSWPAAAPRRRPWCLESTPIRARSIAGISSG